MKYLIVISCILFIIAQMFGNDIFYFAAMYTLIGILLIANVWRDSGIISSFIELCAVLSFWNVVKSLFSNPGIDDIWDYIGLGIGLLFIILKYVFKRFNIRHRA